MYEKSYISYVAKNPSHIKLVYDLQQQAYKVEAELINYSDLPPLKESVCDLMFTGYTYRACQVDFKAQGVKDLGVIAYEEKDNHIDIHKVIVHPEFFHWGIATFLLENLLLENPQCKTFYVSTAKKNIPACKLYEKSGFMLEKEMEKPGITLVEYVKKVD